MVVESTLRVQYCVRMRFCTRITHLMQCCIMWSYGHSCIAARPRPTHQWARRCADASRVYSNHRGVFRTHAGLYWSVCIQACTGENFAAPSGKTQTLPPPAPNLRPTLEMSFSAVRNKCPTDIFLSKFQHEPAVAHTRVARLSAVSRSCLMSGRPLVRRWVQTFDVDELSSLSVSVHTSASPVDLLQPKSVRTSSLPC